VSADQVTEVAFAIYREFSRERDPERARKRFERMPEVTRQQFEAEAKAAISVCRAFNSGAYA
jgi:hypothetical protein